MMLTTTASTTLGSTSISSSTFAYTTTDVPQISFNTTLDGCATKYEDFIFPTNAFCNWTYDTILCWPPTEAGQTARQRCPPSKGVDSSKYAERRCSTEGRWEGRPGQNSSSGWTNYTPCYTPEMLELINKLNAGGNMDIKMDIARVTRTLEIVGFSLSLFALIASLIIFCHFRSLRNNRTRIHKNLFVAMVIQVVIRLTLYLDQAIIGWEQNTNNSSRHGINNTPYLCESSYVLLEYARTAMFMWMFIEGLYLHNVVTVTVFQGRFPHTIYAIAGWGAPLFMTTIWAVVTAHHQRGQNCWWGYNFTPYYWILEGPRLAVILLNFFFLLNIIRVLVVKLRQSHTSDVEQVRKAVRAAVVLVPLLGITNMLSMTEAPLAKDPWEFALWSYTTHFLTSFQGLFIAMLYCFLNGEVRAALLKSLSVYLSLRGRHDWAHRRQSMFSAAYATAPETEPPPHCIANENNTTLGLNHTTSAKTQPSMSYHQWITRCFSGKKKNRDPSPTLGTYNHHLPHAAAPETSV